MRENQSSSFVVSKMKFVLLVAAFTCGVVAGFPFPQTATTDTKGPVGGPLAADGKDVVKDAAAAGKDAADSAAQAAKDAAAAGKDAADSAAQAAKDVVNTATDGLPTHIVGSTVKGVGSMASSGIQMGTNLAGMGMDAGSSAIQKSTSLVNTAAAGGMDIALDLISSGLKMADESVKGGANMASKAVKGAGENMKNIWLVGGMIHKGANMADAAIQKGADMTSSGLASIQSFEKKKFRMIKSALNATTSKIAGMSTTGLEYTKNGVSSVGNVASGMITDVTDTTAGFMNKFFSFIG